MSTKTPHLVDDEGLYAVVRHDDITLILQEDSGSSHGRYVLLRDVGMALRPRAADYPHGTVKLYRYDEPHADSPILVEKFANGALKIGCVSLDVKTSHRVLKAIEREARCNVKITF